MAPGLDHKATDLSGIANVLIASMNSGHKKTRVQIALVFIIFSFGWRYDFNAHPRIIFAGELAQSACVLPGDNSDPVLDWELPGETLHWRYWALTFVDEPWLVDKQVNDDYFSRRVHDLAEHSPHNYPWHNCFRHRKMSASSTCFLE